MINSFLLGQPAPFHGKFYIYPPTVKDVGANPNFNKYLKIFTMSQEEIEDELVEEIKPGEKFPTPFEWLFINCYNSKQFERLAREGFRYFTKNDITFLYQEKKIIVGDLKEEVRKAETLDDLTFLEEEEFFDF